VSTTFRSRLWLIAIAAIVIVSGCAPVSDDVEVTGKVTWEGVPLESASIVLVPVDSHIAPIGGKILNGEFKIRVKPGKVRVEIEAVRETGKRDPVNNSALGEMFIPERYNRKSELKADVTRDGDNHFNYDLRK
jgi:hypothetical protein